MYVDPERQREAKRLYRRSPKGRAARDRYYQRGARYTKNQGLPWVPRDEVLIVGPNKPSDRVLAKKLGRKVLAIQRHRSELRTRTKNLQVAE